MVTNFVDITEVMKFELNRAIVTQLEMKPTTRLLNLDELDLDAIKKYLQETHVILWQNYMLTSTDSLEVAARFIKDLFNKFYEFAIKENAAK